MNRRASILVCVGARPFGVGEDQRRAERLVDALGAAGHTVDLVTLPLAGDGRDSPEASLLWRLVDIDRVDGMPVDVAVCLDENSMFVRHPRKLIWFSAEVDLDALERHCFTGVAGALVSSSPAAAIARAAIESRGPVAVVPADAPDAVLVDAVIEFVRDGSGLSGWR